MKPLSKEAAAQAKIHDMESRPSWFLPVALILVVIVIVALGVYLAN